jgi:hypothetical protein
VSRRIDLISSRLSLPILCGVVGVIFLEQILSATCAAHEPR